MYAKLCPGIKLRGYMFVPQCFYYRYDKNARKLGEDELALLKQCDGRTDIEDSELLQKLIKRRIAEPCKCGDEAEPWQDYRYHENRYFPSAKIAITGKCFFNCRHCFNSASSAAEKTGFTSEELLRLIAELDECGVHSLEITGGEPLLHPALPDMLREIAGRGMHLFEFITTGHLLTEELLDLFKDLGLRPQFKLSYDGIGHHDWFRDCEGAEETLLKNIKLLKSKGFNVRTHTQAYHGNAAVALKTALLCDELGVDEIQSIRTYEVPRPMEAQLPLYTMDEYYEYGLKLIKEFARAGGQSVIDIFQFMRVDTRHKTYSLRAVGGDPCDYRGDRPLCGLARGMLQIDFDGEIWPCLPMSGWCKARGIRYGNVKEQPLGFLLTFTDFIDTLDISLDKRLEHNPECQKCPYYKTCTGGCPIMGMLFSDGDYLARDVSKCLFWKKYFQRTVKMFDGLGFECTQNLRELGVRGIRNVGAGSSRPMG